MIVFAIRDLRLGEDVVTVIVMADVLPKLLDALEDVGNGMFKLAAELAGGADGLSQGSGALITAGKRAG